MTLILEGTMAISTEERRKRNKEAVRKYRETHPFRKKKYWTLEQQLVANNKINKQKSRFVYEYKKSIGCVICGERDPVVLELDHLDPSTKVYHNKTTRQTHWKSFGWEKLKAELAKCQVLCANCHRRKTAKQLGWYNYLEDDES